MALYNNGQNVTFILRLVYISFQKNNDFNPMTLTQASLTPPLKNQFSPSNFLVRK